MQKCVANNIYRLFVRLSGPAQQDSGELQDGLRRPLMTEGSLRLITFFQEGAIQCSNPLDDFRVVSADRYMQRSITSTILFLQERAILRNKPLHDLGSLPLSAADAEQVQLCRSLF